MIEPDEKVELDEVEVKDVLREYIEGTPGNSTDNECFTLGWAYCRYIATYLCQKFTAPKPRSLDVDKLKEVVSNAFYENGYGAGPTVCPECRVDDFVHVEGCEYIGKELDTVIAQAIIKEQTRQGGVE